MEEEEGVSEVGKASNELFEEGESAARPLKFGAVSNVCRKTGAAVNEYTLMIDFSTTTIRSRLPKENFLKMQQNITPSPF